MVGAVAVQNLFTISVCKMEKVEEWFRDRIQEYNSKAKEVAGDLERLVPPLLIARFQYALPVKDGQTYSMETDLSELIAQIMRDKRCTQDMVVSEIVALFAQAKRYKSDRMSQYSCTPAGVVRVVYTQK